MKRVALVRRTPLRRASLLRRRRRPADDRVTPAEALRVFIRESWTCIARRFDPGHHCEGRLSIEHVPGFNENAMGKRGRYLTAACLEAQQGWCLTHRDEERAWLVAQGVMPALEEGFRGQATATA